MHLPYRPKFMPRAARRTAFVSSAAAPAPAIAPAGLHGDRGRVYAPGAVLAYSADRGVVLFRDGPAPSWPGKPEEPALFGGAEAWPRYPFLRRRRRVSWALIVQVGLIAGALLLAATRLPGAGQ